MFSLFCIVELCWAFPQQEYKWLKKRIMLHSIFILFHEWKILTIGNKWWKNDETWMKFIQVYFTPNSFYHFPPGVYGTSLMWLTYIWSKDKPSDLRWKREIILQGTDWILIWPSAGMPGKWWVAWALKMSRYTLVVLSFQFKVLANFFVSYNHFSDSLLPLHNGSS